MKPASAALDIAPGAEVAFRGRKHVVTRILDLDSVLVADAETRIVVHAKIAELSGCGPGAETPAAQAPDLAAVSDKDWEVAKERYEAIKLLLDDPARTRSAVAARAQALGLHPNTLYKWIARYEDAGRTSALLPRSRSDRGATKLSAEIEALVAAVIEEEYLSRQRKSVQKVCDEVRRRCLNAGLAAPHANTVRNRIAAIDDKQKMAKRFGRKAAEQVYEPLEGTFPGADWPLAAVQMDHTKVDLILVDDIHRRPIGRPWITLAIDVFSRMVAGFYVSFDPPGALATGLCVANAILPKDAWLAKRGIDAEWPCWGIPKKLHLDNAREFRGSMLQRACLEYGIDIEWRPVARPHFGGHVERLLGTLSKEIHTLPGTTFSNFRDKKDYDSVAKAALTLSEFEAWLGTYIAKVYHRKVHSVLGVPPIEKYRAGILGDGTKPGVGLPARIADEERLRLDFMPYEERTVQEYGVVVDDIHYFHDVLRRWVKARDPVNPKYRRKLTFRRDPRDISTIWFFDPELNAYFPIPYRDTSHPAISVWELREAWRRLESEGKKHIDERALFEAYERMREIEAEAKAKTVAARRAQQRRKHAAEGILPVSKRHVPVPETSTVEDIAPFDEMDDLAR